MFSHSRIAIRSNIQISKRLVSQFEVNFLRTREANYVPLTPLSFLRRSVELFPDEPAYVHVLDNKPEVTFTYAQMNERISQFASSLVQIGIQPKDVVSLVAPNCQVNYEAHYAVPGMGAILHTINTRLDARTIAYQLQHSKSKLVLVDSESNSVMLEVKKILEQVSANDNDYNVPKFILIRDADNVIPDGHAISEVKFHEWIKGGDSKFELLPVKDENDAITLNYTSGTTGNPKGVVTSHRGSYLNAISNIIEWNMPRFSKFLWVVPMFHCNGWCFPWTMVALGGISYPIRQVRAPLMFELLEKHKIPYFAGAPITMITMLNHAERFKFQHPVKFWVAGAPPPPSLMKEFKDEVGVEVQTAYGLTETYGPNTCHIEDPRWLKDPKITEQDLYARAIYQTKNTLQDDIKVLNPKTMQSVPPDGKTLGEVMIRGNIVMKGYLNNPKATEETFEGGWFHTGDIAVNHGCGKFELKDRSKDIIISGGENISSIEVETIMATHPAISEVAVVAMPDDKWGEVPAAFVVLKKEHTARSGNKNWEEELIKWAKTKMASFQSPKRVIVYSQLPKTSTGKVQKNELRKHFSDLDLQHKTFEYK